VPIVASQSILARRDPPGGTARLLIVTVALYPGSFDPFHLGHLSVVEQAAGAFDEVVVAVLGNPRKESGLFAIAERVRLVDEATAHLPSVRCIASETLAVEVAHQVDASVLIRSAHKERGHERTMSATNRALSGIRTVFIAPDPETRAISSSLVRCLIADGALDAAAALLPPAIRAAVLAFARAHHLVV
jgi:pantetheine-phosphate adenylyltransferase